MAKLSARSTGMTSLLDVPYRTNERYKRGNALYNTNPVKMGEQEAFNIGLLSRPADQAEFMKVYSSSTTHRSEMLGDLLTRNLKDIKEFSLPEDNVASSSTQTVRALFNGLGVNIRNIEE